MQPFLFLFLIIFFHYFAFTLFLYNDKPLRSFHSSRFSISSLLKFSFFSSLSKPFTHFFILFSFSQMESFFHHHHHMNNNSNNNSDAHLPPGFRFHPTDEELITFYLLKKVLDTTFTARAIAEVDLNKCEPWELPGN